MNFSESVPVARQEENDAELSAASSGPARPPALRSVQWAQALILVALYIFPAILILHSASVRDPDIWWHLRSAAWILQHHALPHIDPFSTIGAGKPWTAFSWLFELLIFEIFQRMGLAGIIVYTIGMVVAITVVLQRMILRRQSDFAVATLITLAAIYSLNRLFTPRPWLFSILFFVLVLDALMRARETGRMQPLLWLPVLFALWANLHIQFFAGLFILAIALAEAVLARWWTGIQTRIHAGWMCCIFAVSVAVTLIGPNSLDCYRVLAGFTSGTGFLSKVSEMQAMPFRRFDDWCVLALTLTAAYTLAKARSLPFFEGLLLIFAVYISFHSQRDVWVVIIAACAILAPRLKGDAQNRLRVTASFVPFIAVATGLVILVGFRALQVDNDRLSASLATNFPVHAVELMQEKGWRGPLFNDYNWGGYLLWAQRVPVSTFGGQSIFCNDKEMERSIATWSGQPDWASDPGLAKAGLVIGPVTAPLTQLLRLDPRFQLVYEDKLAAVFIARKGAASGPAAAPAAAEKAVRLPATTEKSRAGK